MSREDSAASQDDDIEASRAPLMEHLIELRTRLVVSLIAVALAFIVCFFLAEPIYNILLRPFEEASRRLRGGELELQLIFTAPLEFFFVKLKLALFGAIIAAFPVIAYQVWSFVRPGLYKNERLAFAPFLIASPILFAAGMAFVYYVILPFILGFALGQEQIAGEGGARRGVEVAGADGLEVEAVAAPGAPELGQLVAGDRKQEAAEAGLAAEAIAGLDAGEESLLDQILVLSVGG